MDISTVDELREIINDVGCINLTEKEYILECPLEINSPVDIKGNKSIIKGQFIISSDVLFEGINFDGKGSIFIIDNGSKVSVISCNFSGNGEGRGIYVVPDSYSDIDISLCKFKKFRVAIDLNVGNILSNLKECHFIDCNIGIENIGENTFIDYENILKNNHYYEKDDVFIKIYTGYSPKDPIYYICEMLSHKNNYARVRGYGVYSSIDTSNIIAHNKDELYDILKVCSKCKNIFLVNGEYLAPIIINKPVSIIGDEDTRLKVNFAFSENCGVIINSSYVIVENIFIDGGKSFNFMYGVKCEIENPTYVAITNFNISNIQNKGIAFYTKWNKNISILHCSISNIKEDCGIYGGGGMIISGNTFTNINEAINLKGVSKVYLRNNSINLCNVAISCSKESIDNLEILDCRFKAEKILDNK